VSHMGIRKISFSGSVGTGKKIAQMTAASNLKRVTLELGGKSPSIVFPDANMENAVRWCTQGIVTNSGQACIASSRAYVHKDIKDTFVAAMKASFEALEPAFGDPYAATTTIPPLVDQLQFDRVLSMVPSGLSPQGIAGLLELPDTCPLALLQVILPAMLELRRERFNVAVSLLCSARLSRTRFFSADVIRADSDLDAILRSRWSGNEVVRLGLVLGEAGCTSIWEETPRCQVTHSKCQHPTSLVFGMALVPARSVSDGGAWQWRGYLGSLGASQKPRTGRARGAFPGWFRTHGLESGVHEWSCREGRRNGTSEISGPNLFLANSSAKRFDCLPRVKLSELDRYLPKGSDCRHHQITACSPRKPLSLKTVGTHGAALLSSCPPGFKRHR